MFPVDHMSDEPSLVRFLDRLSSFGRYVWFDRGRGASDPLPHVEERFAEAEAQGRVEALHEPTGNARRPPRQPLCQDLGSC